MPLVRDVSLSESEPETVGLIRDVTKNAPIGLVRDISETQEPVLRIPTEPTMAQKIAMHPVTEAVVEGIGGVVEPPLSIVSGMIGSAISGLYGIARSWPGGKSPEEGMAKIQNFLMYQPQTGLGKQMTRAAMLPFDLLHKAGQAVGDETLKKTGMPKVAAFLASAVEALPIFIPIAKGVAKGKLSHIEAARRSPAWENISTDFKKLSQEEKMSAIDELSSKYRELSRHEKGGKAGVALMREIDALESGERLNWYERELPEEPIAPPKPEVVEATEGAAKTIVSERSKARKLWEKFRNLWDVEVRFTSIKDMPAPRTGRAAKGYYSMWDAHMERGYHRLGEIAKALDYDKTRLSKIVLNHETPKLMDALSPNERAMYEPAVNLIEEYFQFYRDQYAKRGVKLDFKERIIGEIEQLIKDAESPKDKAELDMLRQEAEEMNFTHIPSAFWFAKKAGEDPAGARAVLKFLFKQKRKTFKIQDLVDSGIISESDVNIGQVIGSYSRRVGRDMATLDLVNEAIKEGLASRSPKPGYIKLAAYDAPAFAKWHLHPVLADYVKRLSGPGLDLGPLNKWMSTTKMTAFINPFFLPMYDLYQNAMLVGVINFPRTAPAMVRGIRHAIKRTPEYYEAMENYLSSQPYNNPFNSHMAMIDWVQKRPGQRVIMSALEMLYPKEFGRFGQKTIPKWAYEDIRKIYNASWYIAWEMDKAIRMGTYEYLRKRGFSPKEAAEFAARGHGDYASVPPGTRRAFNIPLFTPTFKIIMGKFYLDMLKGAAKYGWNFGGLRKKLDPKTKLFAGAAVGTAIINIARNISIEQFLGFDEDEFGRRYVKTVRTPDGPKELVLTTADPSNMFHKYILRGKSAFFDPAVDNRLLRFFEMNKWELHPVWRTAWEIVANKGSDGGPIYHPDDSPLTFGKKVAWYGTSNIVRLFQIFEQRPRDKKARELFARETNQLLEIATYPFVFKYLRSDEDVRRSYQIKQIMKRRKSSLWKNDWNLEREKEAMKKIMEIIGEKEK